MTTDANSRSGGSGADPELRRVEDGLRVFHADYEPPADWQTRVLASVRGSAPKARWRGWLLAMPALAAAVLAIVSWKTTRPSRPAPAQLAWVVTTPQGTVRGPSVHLGDELTFSATGATGAHTHRTLWLYRGRAELLLACPGQAACTEDDTEMRAGFRITRVGQYTLVAIWSDVQLAPPTRSLDDELAAAARAGATIRKEIFIID